MSDRNHTSIDLDQGESGSGLWYYAIRSGRRVVSEVEYWFYGVITNLNIARTITDVSTGSIHRSEYRAFRTLKQARAVSYTHLTLPTILLV